MYNFSGTFVEACDCYSLCPCWVGEDPDDDHCTGLLAWSIATGTIDTRAGANGDGHLVDVSGRCVVAVSTHSGGRAENGQMSVLFVDDGASADQHAALAAAFTGALGGPMADLGEVMGTVLDVRAARIALECSDPDEWSVSVGELIRSEGKPLSFDGHPPMTVANTALDRELSTTGLVTAQRATRLKLNVPTLPADYVDVTERSGMTGAFAYRHDG